MKSFRPVLSLKGVLGNQKLVVRAAHMMLRTGHCMRRIRRPGHQKVEAKGFDFGSYILLVSTVSNASRSSQRWLVVSPPLVLSLV